MSRWLSVEEVLLLHDLALELDGGEPGLLNRVRDGYGAEPMLGGCKIY